MNTQVIFMGVVYQAAKMGGICLLEKPDSDSLYVIVYSLERPVEAYFCEITNLANMLGKVVEANYDDGFVSQKRKSDMDKAEFVQLPDVLGSVVQSGQITDITEEDFNTVKNNCYRPKEP